MIFELEGTLFIEIVEVINNTHEFIDSVLKTKEGERRLREALIPWLKDLENLSVRMNFPSVIAQIHRIRSILDGHDIESIPFRMTELRDRLKDQLQQDLFLYVDSYSAKNYKEETPFGPEVANSIPEIVYDAKEASKCLALNRSTACVFHLCLTMELATEKLRQKVNVKIHPRDTMGMIANKIQVKIEKWKSNTKTQKQKRDRFLEIVTHLKAFTGGLRNPTFHVMRNEVYTETEAQDLFTHVRAFLNRLVKIL